MEITRDIKYIGVNDKEIDLFEEQYPLKYGMAYNSYVIIDDKIAVLDTVESKFSDEWLENLKNAIGNREPDYLIIHHMEPDHSANIMDFAKKYEHAIIVSTEKSFSMMEQFFGDGFAKRRMIVAENDTLPLGKHVLSFKIAPMVHWPEVMVTYDKYDKVLFSADAFGKFGTNDIEDDWEHEAARYYFGIIGKYGEQVNKLLDKIKSLDINIICSSHGMVLKGDLDNYIEHYRKWASYEADIDGVAIIYTSVYGNTKKAVKNLAERLHLNDCTIITHDLSRCDPHAALTDAFRYKKTVLATTTYNGEIFPKMREFINMLCERNFKNRTLGLVENGTWSPNAIKTMKKMLERSSGISYLENCVSIKSALNDESEKQLKALSDELCKK
ncbi:MAG: FprA family A-type flavoprotein [Clostridia bacterium]|nr:FprA family A-type flavoprotein [Clostridia bacterium]